MGLIQRLAKIEKNITPKANWTCIVEILDDEAFEKAKLEPQVKGVRTVFVNIEED